MPKPIDVPALLRAFQKRRAKETAQPFNQEMGAAEVGVPVKTYYHWIQGKRTPRGLSLEMLLTKVRPAKVSPNGKGSKA